MTSLLVKLDPALHSSRVEGLFLNISTLPGVAVVCDLERITPETLAAILLAPVCEVPAAAEPIQEALL